MIKKNNNMKITLSKRKARELGILWCKCGHPKSNHFDFDTKSCARVECKCTKLNETLLANGVEYA